MQEPCLVVNIEGPKGIQSRPRSHSNEERAAILKESTQTGKLEDIPFDQLHILKAPAEELCLQQTQSCFSPSCPPCEASNR